MSKVLKSLLVVVLALGAQWAVASEDAMFSIYGQYERVTPPQPTEAPGQVEVLELFWYGCSHCYDFEPHLNQWLSGKPAYVSFRRMPAVFRPEWIPHARGYYTAELLGVVDKIHGPLFTAMHQHKRKVETREELAAFFAEQGVSAADFNKTYDSFAVESRTRRAMQMTERYGIAGVPSVIINGVYRTSGTTAGTFENVIKVMNVLVDEQHRSAGGSAAGDGGSKQ
jgi:thiol:disulfide interchange protein DsbA